MKLESCIGELERKQREAKAKSCLAISDTKRLRQTLDILFDESSSNERTDCPIEERRLIWPAWQLWKLLIRLEELGITSCRVEYVARSLVVQINQWILTACKPQEPLTCLEHGPISCEDLHNVKFALRNDFWNFAEFGVNKARQIDHLHINERTEVTIREARIRMEESGSTIPDELLPFDS